MNLRKGLLIVFLVCGLVSLSLFGGACGTNDRSKDVPQKDNEKVVTATNEYPTSSAIGKAKALQDRSQNLQSFKDEASQFGLHLWSSDEDEYKQVRDRLFANDKLASVLRTANDEGVFVYLKRRFYVGTGHVDIDVDATDQEIIEFLIISTPEAKAREASFDKLRSEASQFGLHLWPSDEDEYRQIRDRLLTNEQVASALKRAAREGIQIRLEHEFQIKANAIDINVDATDQEIIEFLLGK